MKKELETKYKQIMVHGRFQPFHKEHLEYVLNGLRYGEKVVIGITNPEPTELVRQEESNHRHLRESNPFNYFEREDMILRSLKEVGVDLSLVRCVPFHVFDEGKWKSYLPEKNVVVHLIRLFSDWEKNKVEKLMGYGFHVEVLDRNATKGMTATQVRDALRSGVEWESFVPNGTREVIREMINDGTLKKKIFF